MFKVNNKNTSICLLRKFKVDQQILGQLFGNKYEYLN